MLEFLTEYYLIFFLFSSSSFARSSSVNFSNNNLVKRVGITFEVDNRKGEEILWFFGSCTNFFFLFLYFRLILWGKFFLFVAFFFDLLLFSLYLSLCLSSKFLLLLLEYKLYIVLIKC